MAEVSDLRRIIPEPHTIEPARDRKEKRSRGGSERFNSELRKRVKKEPKDSKADEKAREKERLGREDTEQKTDDVPEDEPSDAEENPNDEDSPDLPTGRIVDIKV